MLSNRSILLATGVAAGVFGAGAAAAQTVPPSGTVAGTTISNQANASYTVNGTPQTTQSNTTTFVVDRKVNLTLITDQSGPTSVNLGQTGAVTRFRLTNNTNATQDFILDADQQNIVAGVLPGTDDFDVTNVHIYVDKNGNGVYDPGVDTASYVDELPPDTSVEIFIVADVPGTGLFNQSFVALHATVAAGGTPGTMGAALVPTTDLVANSDTTVDVVFADGDSDGGFPGDVARNGQSRVYAAYAISTHNVNLTVTKSSRVLTDGVSVTNPKALPGATVEYCLVVNNATLMTGASNVVLTDLIPTNTTYVPGSISLGSLSGTTGCVVNGVPQSDSTSYDSGANKVTVTIPTLAGGATVAASFDVTIK